MWTHATNKPQSCPPASCWPHSSDTVQIRAETPTLAVSKGTKHTGAGSRTRPTFTAVLPHAQVDPGNVVTAAVAMGKLRHSEHIPLHTRDVVGIVTQDPGQGRLLDLRQLGRGKQPRVLIPQPVTAEWHSVRELGAQPHGVGPTRPLCHFQQCNAFNKIP